ncbi:hypothetical protein EDI_201350 [Entamoeba dispar SAW760]|uniref:RRM domain-containing protein n=1 Tax=Entamoeba dispar (strain ATCC PRA-260 / SAW760) TaxID=370354 RepID=B0ETU3_ENTDS|nr:uncharacterized protein EDI_201350 [Entamoeba dispar SAW760]EDR22019.1 hypothetical protein EDI_201350 [Entamoeba dispar SAW760]|eukprot:EDR22019.1 hypothetical protein EDI_201350 [Entamoeba dispar SAW760]
MERRRYGNKSFSNSRRYRNNNQRINGDSMPPRRDKNDRETPAPQYVKVRVTNLGPKVTEEDINKLCSMNQVEPLKAFLKAQQDGSNIATVLFKTEEDANKIINAYKNVEFDGKLMNFEIISTKSHQGHHNDRRRRLHDGRNRQRRFGGMRRGFRNSLIDNVTREIIRRERMYEQNLSGKRGRFDGRRGLSRIGRRHMNHSNRRNDNRIKRNTNERRQPRMSYEKRLENMNSKLEAYMKS